MGSFMVPIASGTGTEMKNNLQQPVSFLLLHH